MTLPKPEGPLEPHQFEGNALCMSKVEQLTGLGWVVLEEFAATPAGLRRATRRFDRACKAPGAMGVALWIGPSLACCLLSRSIRRFYREGPPALTCKVIKTTGEEVKT